MNPFIVQAFEEFKVGSALHLPFLYSAVIGLEAQHVFEVGAGVSTMAILEALYKTGGELVSCSTDWQTEILPKNYGSTVPWTHLHGQSQEKIPEYLAQAEKPWFDLVFHDGSHSAEVVQSDLQWLLPRVKTYGLVLIHDTLHSYSGDEMRVGVENGLAIWGNSYSAVTLPYGFGLTVIRVEPDDTARGGRYRSRPEIEISRSKVGSKHVTEQKADSWFSPER